MITLSNEQVEAVVRGIRDGRQVVSFDDLEVSIEYKNSRVDCISLWQYMYPLEDWTEVPLDGDSVRDIMNGLEN